MKQAIITLALAGVLFFQLQYFEIIDILDLTKNSLQYLKKSQSFLLILQSSLILVLISILVLHFLQKNIQKKKVIYNCAPKKSRSEFENEVKRETRKSVDALINSEEFRQHRNLYKTSDDFISQREMNESDELSDSLTESDNEVESDENNQ
ncbi:hypothetical protein ABPG72_010408 [Tetrahymena utriculariae]